MKRLKKRFAAIAICCAVIMTSFAGTQLAVSAEQMDEPRYPTSGSTTTSSSSGKFTTSAVYPYTSVKAAITKAKETNKDVKGWLIVPGTNINAPILQGATSKDFRYYYNDRDWTGKQYPNNNYKNFADTAEYLDYRSVVGDTWSATSRNTVIYGHNWTNLAKGGKVDVGTSNSHLMMGQLPSYTDINFAKKNPYIYYSTDKNEGVWKVFCVAYVETSLDFPYNSPNPTKEAFTTLVSEWKDRSMYDFGVDVNENDRILTLSTCTRRYDVGDDQRFVVVARLLRDGESEKDTITVSVNQDMKQPKITSK